MHLRIPHFSRIVTYSATGFIVGTVVGVGMSVHALEALAFFIAISALIALVFFAHEDRSWCIVLALLAALFGMRSMVIAQNSVATWHGRAGEHLEQTVIVRDVRTGAYQARVIAQQEHRRDRIMWYDVKYPAVVPGDRLAMRCTLAVPPTDFLPTYPMLLASRRVMAMCENPQYVVVGRATDVVTIAGDLRSHLMTPIMTMIPAPYSALAVGLLFGGDDLLSQDIQDAFARTGMSHIVAVSGYNVSVIIAAVVSALIFIGLYRSRATFFAMIAIVAFVALIGFPASGVRAALMGTLVLVAASYGRVAHAYGALALAGAAMLVHNPLLIIYDIGFQLSFLATYGIITVVPLAEHAMQRVPRAFGLVDIIIVTLAAQIFVLPVIMYHFHTVSFISLLVNIFVLPVIPIAMLSSLMVVVLSWIMMPIGMLFAWMAYSVLAYIIRVVEYAAQVPWAAMDAVHLSMWMAVVYYVILFVGISMLRKKMTYHTV